MRLLKKRRLANQVICDACTEMRLSTGLRGRVQLAAMVYGGNGEALLALEQARLKLVDENPDLIVGSPDWDEIFEMILKIIELLMLIAPFFI